MTDRFIDADDLHRAVRERGRLWPASRLPPIDQAQRHEVVGQSSVASSRAAHVARSYPLGIWHASSARPALVSGT